MKPWVLLCASLVAASMALTLPAAAESVRVQYGELDLSGPQGRQSPARAASSRGRRYLRRCADSHELASLQEGVSALRKRYCEPRDRQPSAGCADRASRSADTFDLTLTKAGIARVRRVSSTKSKGTSSKPVRGTPGMHDRRVCGCHCRTPSIFSRGAAAAPAPRKPDPYRRRTSAVAKGSCHRGPSIEPKNVGPGRSSKSAPRPRWAAIHRSSRLLMLDHLAAAADRDV